MHDTTFDHLARTMRARPSRRGLLRALAGGGLTLGVAGWTEVQDTAAKSCKRIKDKKKRKKCLAKVTSPTAQLPAPPPPPVACPSGTFALAGRCAPVCAQGCLERGGGCGETFDGFLFCAPRIDSCAPIPKVCSSHANCGSQEFCTRLRCALDTEPENRCAPFLN